MMGEHNRKGCDWPYSPGLLKLFNKVETFLQVTLQVVKTSAENLKVDLWAWGDPGSTQSSVEQGKLLTAAFLKEDKI